MHWKQFCIGFFTFHNQDLMFNNLESCDLIWHSVGRNRQMFRKRNGWMINQVQTFSGCLQPWELQGCAGRGCATKLREALPAGSAPARRPRFPGSSLRPALRALPTPHAPHVGCAWKGGGPSSLMSKPAPSSRRAPGLRGHVPWAARRQGALSALPGRGAGRLLRGFLRAEGVPSARQTWFCKVSADAA